MSSTADHGPADAADPGLQPERTSLAWRRTGLAATTAALVMVRVAVAREATAVAALSAGLVIVAIGALLEGSAQHRQRRSAFDGGHPQRSLSLAARTTTAVTVGLACAGVWLALTG